MKTDIYLIDEEYKVAVTGLEFQIGGRILKEILPISERPTYKYQLSHYCKQEITATDVYIPGKENVPLSNKDDAKRYLLNYLKAFTSHKVVPNPLY